MNTSREKRKRTTTIMKKNEAYIELGIYGTNQPDPRYVCIYLKCLNHSIICQNYDKVKIKSAPIQWHIGHMQRNKLKHFTSAQT